jgi:DNA-binding Xre family transcriptional regulator
MKTTLGKYLDNKKSNKAKIASIIGLTEDRMNALSNEDTAILYADELYRILHVANFYADITTDKFDDSVSEIFPDRKKGVLVDKFNHLSPTAKLFSIYTQPKREVEATIGMPKNKMSKFSSGNNKRATASELINFCDGMNFPLYETFKDLFGELNLTEDKTDVQIKD